MLKTYFGYMVIIHVCTSDAYFNINRFRGEKNQQYGTVFVDIHKPKEKEDLLFKEKKKKKVLHIQILNQREWH